MQSIKQKKIEIKELDKTFQLYLDKKKFIPKYY